jgi:hypothetical protein
MEREHTVNSERYSTMLKDKLKPAIRCERIELLSKTVLLRHGNARPFAAAATIETIQKLNFELLPHPPYSPHSYSPSDSLKKALRRSRFGSDEKVKQAVLTWLCDQPETFFCDGIKKLVERCKKCVDK